MTTQDTSTMLTVDDVAELVGVAHNTVYNHRAEIQPDECTGVLLFPLAAVEAWTILRDGDVLERADVVAAGVTSVDLLQARLRRVILPTKPGDARISYADVQRVIAWKRAGMPRPDVSAGPAAPPVDDAAVMPPPDILTHALEDQPAVSTAVASTDNDAILAATLPASILTALEKIPNGFRGLKRYIRTGDLTSIPLPFWFAPQCPRIILPAGAYRARYRHAVRDPKTGQWRTYIQVDAHYSSHEVVEFVDHHGPTMSAWDDGLFECGMVPARYELPHRRSEFATRAWESYWLGIRLRHLTELGLPVEVHADEATSELRDHIGVERRYHLDGLCPAELPDYYLVSKPPLLPRVNVFRYVFGRPVRVALGVDYTPVNRSAGWLRAPGEVPHWEPSTVVQCAIGVWPEGEPVPWWEAANREHDVGASEWAGEIDIRLRRWPMRPALTARPKGLK